jgi:hypothetical protein
MTRETASLYPRRTITPSQLPLGEKAALAERLQRGRQQQPPKSWQQFSLEEGFSRRTLQHFLSTALELEKNADRRPEEVRDNERCGRAIHARLVASSPGGRWIWERGGPQVGGDDGARGQTLDDRLRVSEDFVPPPLRRHVTPSQLPYREQAELLDRIREARQRKPHRSWRYLAIEQGFAQRTIEHFHLSATKLEKNADGRMLSEHLAQQIARLRAQESGEVRHPRGRRGERRGGSTEHGRADERGREWGREKEVRERLLLADERKAAEARDVEREQQRARNYREMAQANARKIEEQLAHETEEAEAREADPLWEARQTWDPGWGPMPM